MIPTTQSIQERNRQALMAQGFFSQDDVKDLTQEKAHYIFNDVGYSLLSSKTVTIESLKPFNSSQLSHILNEFGQEILSEKLLQLKDLESINHDNLAYLFTNNGATCLREKLITLDEVRTLENHMVLCCMVFYDKGLALLRDGTYTLTTAKDLPIERLLEQTKPEPTPTNTFGR